MSTPEARARSLIDRQLQAAGWLLQNREEFNRRVGRGVAVREFPLPAGEADYLLFIDGRAAGVIEAKKAGTTLSGFAEQSEKYLAQLPEHLDAWADPLPFGYESTGIETLFRDLRDPKPRSRPVFAFHKPETLAEWLAQPATLRRRLQQMPPLITQGLRGCQIEAIENLERSLAADHPRSLIQMATGSGKTFTACNFSYRLIKHAGARRILFLVDRNNLGDQTLREFQAFTTPDDGRNFTSLYNVQHLQSNRIDPVAKVCITTIQRLYSMLRGEEDYDPAAEEVSTFETALGAGERERPVAYNPNIPIEMFDFVVTDECHRSIYKVWRQVLEYFDAHIIGLTATPSKLTLGFFGNNLVMTYPYERSVADGVNVGYEIYRIKTKVSEEGSRVEAGYALGYRDRRTRMKRWEELDQEFEYKAQQLDRSVTTPDQIRTILKAYRDKLTSELFPGRDWVPKTLIFAKDDNHAEEITHIAREVFEQGNEFCKKITYQAAESPKELIKRFRTDPMPRIGVTVDMVATGTDVRPIEALIFMRDVKSEIYFEQMKGRGARIIQPSDLKQVTPDAAAKTRFVLIDAVGVTETNKSDNQPLERKPGVAFGKLIEQVAMGRRDDDSLSSLAGRLAGLERELEGRGQAGAEDLRRIENAAGGQRLKDLANTLLDAIDPDKIEAEAIERFGPVPSDQQYAEVEKALKEKACDPFDSALLRRTLIDIKQKSEIAIDEITTDVVTYAGYDVERARDDPAFRGVHRREQGPPRRAPDPAGPALPCPPPDLRRDRRAGRRADPGALAAGCGAGLAGLPAPRRQQGTRRTRKGADRPHRAGALRRWRRRRGPGALLPARRAALQSLGRPADEGRADLHGRADGMAKADQGSCRRQRGGDDRRPQRDSQLHRPRWASEGEARVRRAAAAYARGTQRGAGGMNDVFVPHRSGRWPLPESWCWAKGLDFAEIVGGGTPKNASDPSNYSDDGFPWVTPADLSGYSGTYIERGARSLSPHGLKQSSARIMPPNTVLFSSRAPVGYCVIARNSIATNQGFKSFVAHKEIVPEYLRYYLLASKDYAEQEASGTTFRELSGAAAGSLLFPIAPRAEQERIAAKIDELFSELDAGVASLKRAKALLKKYRQAVLKAAVTGELTRDWRERHKGKIRESGADLLQRMLKERRRAWEAAELNKLRAKGKPSNDDRWKQKYKEPQPPDTTGLPDLPEGWAWATVLQISSRVTDGTHQSPDFVISGIPFIIINDVTSGQIDWRNVSKWVSRETFEACTARCRPERGDVLYTAVGSYGIAVEVVTDREFMFQRHIAHIKPLREQINPAYVALVLNSPMSLRRAHKVALGVAQKTVTLGELAAFPIPVPPFAEQEAITGEAERLMSVIDALENELALGIRQNASLRQSILKAAFAGRLVPQDLSDEPASMLLERIRAERAAKPRPARGRRTFGGSKWHEDQLDLAFDRGDAA
jgi:type I restriction enzyme, R subunit